MGVAHRPLGWVPWKLCTGWLRLIFKLCHPGLHKRRAGREPLRHRQTPVSKMSKGGAGISSPHWTREALGQKGPWPPPSCSHHTPAPWGWGTRGRCWGRPCAQRQGATGWEGSLNTRTTVLEGLHLSLWVQGQNSDPRRGGHEVAGAGWEHEAGSLQFRGCCGPQAAVRRARTAGERLQGWAWASTAAGYRRRPSGRLAGQRELVLF